MNGWDAGHKAIILASLAYGFWVGSEKVYVEGIQEITGAKILSMYQDFSTVTGEEIIVFTLAETPYCRDARRR